MRRSMPHHAWQVFIHRHRGRGFVYYYGGWWYPYPWWDSYYGSYYYDDCYWDRQCAWQWG